MFNGSDLIYSYDGSFEGFLTVVFEAYENKTSPISIQPEGAVQSQLNAVIKHIDTDQVKCERVYKGIQKQMGGHLLYKVSMAFLSVDEGKDIKLLNYIKRGFQVGRRLQYMLADDVVNDVEKIARYVGSELNKLMGFLRFSRMENMVYYSEISPNNNLMPLLMPHFVNRFSSMPFVINDTIRKIAGIYDTKEWYITKYDELSMPGYSNDEQEYRRLWKKFYDTIAVESRVSEKRRMGLMPKRYWKHITEMTYLYETQKNIPAAKPLPH